MDQYVLIFLGNEWLKVNPDHVKLRLCYCPVTSLNEFVDCYVAVTI